MRIIRSLSVHLIITLLMVGQVLPTWATQYYIDSAAPGPTHDGTSWNNAWLDFANVTGLHPGDTVDISGGASGITYNTPQDANFGSGTVGNPITFRVSTSAGKNGMVTVTTPGGSPFHWIFSAPSSNRNQWLTFSGEVNGEAKMTLSPGSNIIASFANSQGLTFRYLTANGRFDGYDSDAIEFDHVTLNAINWLDHAIVGVGRRFGTVAYSSGFTQWSLHDSTIYIAQKTGSGLGDDGLQNVANGSIYNNRFIGVDMAYIGGQHGDGIQTNGPNLKVYNNHFENIHNYPIFFELTNAAGATDSSLYVYNNTFYNNQSQNIAIGAQAGKTGQIISNIFVFNNTLVNAAKGGTGSALTINSTQGITYVTSYAVNNLIYDSPSPSNIAASVTASNNTNGTTTNITFSDPASNWHLISGTAVVDQGISPSYLTSITTTDKAGVSRPTGAAWDIGAYEVFGTPPPNTPTGHHIAAFTGPTWCIPIWAPNTDATYIGYLVYRSLISGTYGGPLATITAASAAASHSPMTQYNDHGLLTAGTYYYKIGAYDVNGNISTLTSELSCTVTGKQ